MYRKTTLSFYRSGEVTKRRASALVTAGRCSTTTSTTTAACIAVELSSD